MRMRRLGGHVLCIDICYMHLDGYGSIALGVGHCLGWNGHDIRSHCICMK